VSPPNPALKPYRRCFTNIHLEAEIVAVRQLVIVLRRAQKGESASGLANDSKEQFTQAQQAILDFVPRTLNATCGRAVIRALVH
jgi:hypothetical protein